MNDQTNTPFETLDKEVYPVLNEALHKLINHIVKTEQVRKHQQRLTQQRVLDELQAKREGREKERQQLGSDYDSSDDEKYFNSLKMTKQQVEDLLSERKTTQTKKLSTETFNPIAYLVQQLKTARDSKHTD